MIKFLTVWGSGGVSTLYLTCVSGQVNVVFSCSLYDSTIKPAPLPPPQAPPPSSPGDTRERQPHHHPKHHPHPPLLPRQLRCRGPADKERSRRRAAKYQQQQQTISPSGPISLSSPTLVTRVSYSQVTKPLSTTYLLPTTPSSPGCRTDMSPSHPPPTYLLTTTPSSPHPPPEIWSHC